MIPLRDENPTARTAVITILLILVNLGVYFGVQLPKHADAETAFEYRWAGVPCEVRTGRPIEIVPVGDPAPAAAHGCTIEATGIARPERAFPQKNVWLAIFVSMFLHGSILHVLGNMLFLWIFGNNVEDQLGRFWYLVLYLAGGIVASLVHIAGNLHSTAPFVGASGAIAVVMGAYIVWFPRARVLTLVPIVLVFLPVRLPAIVVLGLWFVLQIATQTSSGIATLAHIGGFVFGLLVAFALARARGYPRRLMPGAPAGA